MGKLEVKKILPVEVWANFRENTNHYYRFNMRRTIGAFVTCVALPIFVYRLTATDVVRDFIFRCGFPEAHEALLCCAHFFFGLIHHFVLRALILTLSTGGNRRSGRTRSILLESSFIQLHHLR
jgi:hypothetical protein